MREDLNSRRVNRINISIILVRAHRKMYRSINNTRIEVILRMLSALYNSLSPSSLYSLLFSAEPIIENWINGLLEDLSSSHPPKERVKIVRILSPVIIRPHIIASLSNNKRIGWHSWCIWQIWHVLFINSITPINV